MKTDALRHPGRPDPAAAIARAARLLTRQPGVPILALCAAALTAALIKSGIL